MDFMEVINNRRSVRAYKPDPVEKDKIQRVIDAAVKAPTGMNAQPWAFGVIQDQATLASISEQAKAFLLSKADEWAWLAPYKDYFADPDYSIFYHAPALVVIYSTGKGPVAQVDCTLAAENLMLAACEAGLGTCWIGFATEIVNAPELKKQMGVPDDYAVIAPIILGYPNGPIPAPDKNPPEVIYWK